MYIWPILDANKPENPFQNYDSLKTILSTTEIFLYKDILIQPSEVQKPGTGQKTGPQTTGKIIRVNEPA